MSRHFTIFDNKSTTKSVILLTMRENASQEFVEWLKMEMNKKNLVVTSAARFIGVSHPTITQIVTYHEKPTCETCFKIADAFHVSREFVLRLAGWLPPISDSEEIIRQTMEDMGFVSQDAQKIISRVVRVIREESEVYKP